MRIDLLHLIRGLRRSPASALAVIVTLAITLGAGASIFALIDAVVLTPPPFIDPGRLVVVREVPAADPTATPRAVGYATFQAWQERVGSQATLEATDGTNLTLTGLGPAERLSAVNVTPGFLQLLGVTPAIGRSFEPTDMGQRVAIVSHAFWRTKLASDPGAVGRQLILGNEPHTIVGVLPERFASALGDSVLWRPFPVTAAQAVANGSRVNAMGRLAPGVSAADLGGALDDVSRSSSPPARAMATPLTAAIAGSAAGTLGVLAGAAALALAIAFTNLAGLLIVRSIDRRRELAVRTALGARPFEIAKQLLLESSTLVAMGTIAGILLAMWLTPAVARLALPQFGAAAQTDVTVSWRVIGAVAVVAAACAWLCAAIPASAAARRGSLDLLRRGATSPPRERALRRLFVAVEVALAFVLLVSMTMVGRSLVTVLRVDPGFESDGVLTLKMALPSAAYNGDRVAAFYRTLRGAVEERLGAGTTSVIDELPLTHDRGRSVVRAHAADAGSDAVVRSIAPGYFEVMRIPIRDGRGFDRGDTSAAPPRVVVSESLAVRLFPSEQGAGRQVLIGATGQRVEVVGVVGDVKHRSLDEKTAPTVYVSAAQQPSNGSIMVVRSGRPDADVIAAVREEVMRLDVELPVYGVTSMREVTDRSPGVPARRVLTAAFSGFALVAVVLGTLGLFGVVAHDVASRRAELALRIALGADPRRIVAATLRQGAMVVGTGLAVGGILSIWATRALSGGLPGAIQLDILSVAGPAIVLAIAGAAAVVPVARRAAHTDPLELLRAD